MLKFLEEEMSVARFCRVVKELDPRVSKRSVKRWLDCGLTADTIGNIVAARTYHPEIAESFVPHTVHPWSVLYSELVNPVVQLAVAA